MPGVTSESFQVIISVSIAAVGVVIYGFLYNWHILHVHDSGTS